MDSMLIFFHFAFSSIWHKSWFLSFDWLWSRTEFFKKLNYLDLYNNLPHITRKKFTGKKILSKLQNKIQKKKMMVVTILIANHYILLQKEFIEKKLYKETNN